MKKILSVVLLTIMLLGVLAGCSSQVANENSANVSGGGKSGNEQAAANEVDNFNERLDITWMVRSFQGGGWPEDHPMIEAINEKFNVNLHIQWIPAANYAEKLNVLAASNDFPDMYLVLSEEFSKWKDKGLFLDIQPLLVDYPHLAAIPAEDLHNLNPKGQVLGLPYYLTKARDSLSVREDWLEKLNLQVPETLDEFYEVAKAFATQDPDNNGQHDTSGFSLYIDHTSGTLVGIEYIMAGFGLANQWKEEDGKLIPYQTQVTEWKQVLAYLNRAYTEGVLDRDFAVNKLRAPLEKLETNKIGFAYANPNQYQNSINSLKKLVPEGNIVPITPPTGPTGLTGTSTLDMLDKNVINANIDLKKQKRILAILDYFLSPEGSDFIKHGIEGVHYNKISEDQYEKLEAADKDRQNLINNWIFRPFDPGIQMYKWDNAETHQKIARMFAENEQHIWQNPAAGLESDTLNKSGANINGKFISTVAEIIVGRKQVDEIEQASADWLASGGSKIAEEINEAYAITQ